MTQISILASINRFGTLWVLDKASGRPLAALIGTRGLGTLGLEQVEEYTWYTPGGSTRWEVDIHLRWYAPFDKDEGGDYSFEEWYADDPEWEAAANSSDGILRLDSGEKAEGRPVVVAMPAPEAMPAETVPDILLETEERTMAALGAMPDFVLPKVRVVREDGFVLMENVDEDQAIRALANIGAQQVQGNGGGFGCWWEMSGDPRKIQIEER